MSERTTDEFWIDLITDESGNLDREKILNELSDFSMVMDHCRQAYMWMTDGRISKPNTLIEQVIAVAEDCRNDDCQRAVDDYIEDHSQPTVQPSLSARELANEILDIAVDNAECIDTDSDTQTFSYKPKTAERIASLIDQAIEDAADTCRQFLKALVSETMALEDHGDKWDNEHLASKILLFTQDPRPAHQRGEE